MQEKDSPHAQPTPADVDAAEGTESLASPLGPAYALLRAFLGSEIPAGPLGPDTIPVAALEVPVTLAIEYLVQHAKYCSNVRCSHFPPSLKRYRRTRPSSLRALSSPVFNVLWTDPTHKLVRDVRQRVLHENADLAEDISEGRLLKDGRLDELLSARGLDGARRLAAVLWASDFHGPGAEQLFRSIVPLVRGGPSHTETSDSSHDDAKLKELETALRKTRRTLKQAQMEASAAAKDAKATATALKKSKQEIERLQERYDATKSQLKARTEQARQDRASLRSISRESDKTSEAAAKLRSDRNQLKADLRSLESDRSKLARMLGAARRQLEQLRFQLEFAAAGSQATWDFLRDEEARIQQDRLIYSGGRKDRANKEWTANRKLRKAFLNAYPEYQQDRPEKILPKTPLQFFALGGADEVGRSCYLLRLGDKNILIDCGIKPGDAADSVPALDELEGIDALILTHAHTDHVGWVPALIHRYGEFDIYCSEGTAALLPVVLDDCRRHYTRKLAAQNDKARFVRNAAPVQEEYSAADVHAVTNLVITCRFGETEQLRFGGVTIQFFRAGHILGAASVLIEDRTGRRIFISGDFSSFPQLTVDRADWPSELDEIDLLVLESTYGKSTHPSFEEARNDLIGFVRDTTQKQEGSVLLAAFALGRAQELLKLMVTARERGDVPNVPIVADGMIRRINPIYRDLADFHLPDGSFDEIAGESERDYMVTDAQRAPTIIVTTSGMLAGGPVVEYAKHLLPDRRHRIVLTGFQDEGAPSRALRKLTQSGRSGRKVELLGEDGEVIRFEAAHPAKEVKLSSHADQPGLLQYAGLLRPRNVVLVHGEPSAQSALSTQLAKMHPAARIVCGASELAIR